MKWKENKVGVRLFEEEMSTLSLCLVILKPVDASTQFVIPDKVVFKMVYYLFQCIQVIEISCLKQVAEEDLADGTLQDTGSGLTSC